MNKWSLLVPGVLFFLGACGVQSPNTAYQVAVPAGYNWPATDTFKVLSWNVEHFVDEYDDPYVRNNRENSPGEVEERVQLLAEAIREANADVVVLQEFESAAFARQIANDYLQDMGYRFFGAAESDNWYMNVVVMSRVPLGVLYSYGRLYTPVEGFTDEAGNPEAQININTRMWSVDVLPSPDYRFVLTGLHLKAGRDDDDVAARKGQFNFLQSQFKRFAAENPDVNLLVTGDLNSKPDSEELKILLEAKGATNFEDPLAGTGTFSHTSEKPFWRIDHILPNQNMAKELLPGSVQVQYLLNKEKMMKISDHLPLTAVFVARER